MANGKIQDGMPEGLTKLIGAIRTAINVIVVLMISLIVLIFIAQQIREFVMGFAEKSETSPREERTHAAPKDYDYLIVPGSEAEFDLEKDSWKTVRVTDAVPCEYRLVGGGKDCYVYYSIMKDGKGPTRPAFKRLSPEQSVEIPMGHRRYVYFCGEGHVKIVGNRLPSLL